MSATTFFDKEYKAPLSVVEPISKTPYFYQANGVNAVADSICEGHNRILVKGPTGCGKTLIGKLVCLSERIRGLVSDDEQVISGEKPLRVLYIANKHRLNRQALEEYNENPSVELIVHSAMSPISKETMDYGWDLCIIDEAHHEAMMSIQLLLDSIADKLIIGLTADDKRGDGVLVKFSKIIETISEYEAANRGFIEKAGINTVIDTGKTDKSELACQILERYHTHMGNTIVFFRTEKEVNKTFRFMRRMGLSVDRLVAGNTEADLDEKLVKLSQGKIQFLLNCQRIGEGIDTPHVTDVLLAINFSTHAQKKQFIGRAARSDSPCAVWDFINPLKKTIEAKKVVGDTKYERLIWQRGGEFHERLYTGEDATWGQMSELRHIADRDATGGTEVQAESDPVDNAVFFPVKSENDSVSLEKEQIDMFGELGSDSAFQLMSA